MSFLNNLFGGSNTVPTNLTAPQINFTPSTFGSTGATFSGSGGNYNLTPTAAASSAIGGLQSTFQNQAGAYGALANTVRPGFSQLRRAGLNQINTQQQATTSNLRDNLAQRRILGSSFAQASLSQNDAEFAQQKANFVAQSYLSELSSSQQLIQQQYQAAAQSYTVGINQMNFDTQLAAQLTSQATSASAAVAEAQANLDSQTARANLQAQEFNAQQQSQAQAGVGKLLGTVASIGLAPFTGGLSLAALPAFAGGSGGGGFFSGGQYTGPNSADLGWTGGTGSGGYNFLDAQA